MPEPIIYTIVVEVWRQELLAVQRDILECDPMTTCYGCCLMAHGSQVTRLGFCKSVGQFLCRSCATAGRKPAQIALIRLN
jgi:hypothetical protein